MEYFDIVDENGQPTGIVEERSIVHAKGLAHRAVHMWIYRIHKGTLQLLLQKRSSTKDSHPSCYDMSSAGHVSAGDDFYESALRELTEELGVNAQTLYELFPYPVSYTKVFHDKTFIEKEYNMVYALKLDWEEASFILQEEEVELVKWFDASAVLELAKSDGAHCLIFDEVMKVIDWIEAYEKKTLSFKKKI